MSAYNTVLAIGSVCGAEIGDICKLVMVCLFYVKLYSMHCYLFSGGKLTKVSNE